MTNSEKEQHDHVMVATLNAERFGFVETAKALRSIAATIRELSGIAFTSDEQSTFAAKECERAVD
jgi:hypothetical protein